jgi:hypothetical protein
MIDGIPAPYAPPHVSTSALSSRTVVNLPVLGVVAPTVPLMLIELTPVKVLFNPRIEAPEVP